MHQGGRLQSVVQAFAHHQAAGGGAQFGIEQGHELLVFQRPGPNSSRVISVLARFDMNIAYHNCHLLSVPDSG